jgi:long-chain acyl-CoA synthetase
MNLAQLAEDSAARLGERMTLVFDEERFTNWQLLDWARRLQGGFSDLGLGRGTAAILCLANHPLVYPVFQGIFRAGGTAVPVMPQLAVPEIRHIVSDTGARGVVTDTAGLPKIREAVRGLTHVRWIVVRGGEDAPSGSPPERRLETLLGAAPITVLPAIDAEDVALMLYTSGTTGNPKGVMLTHANLLASAEAGNEASELDRWQTRRVSVSGMPMAHIFGVGVMNSGYLVPERLADGYGVQMAWFEPERFMQLIQEHRCTVIPAVPTMLALILNHPKVSQYDLTSLEEVVCGAAPLPVGLARAFSERFGCRIREIYGLTESTGLGSANRLSEPYRPGSAGRAYCNTEVRIVGGDDRPLPAGERGGVVLRGPSIMKGYHNRPEETATALRGGWLHTGDVGYLDVEGYLYIVDRKKDMIIRGGENIYPAELESILYRHPGVAEAAVVGAPDRVYGENVIAYVVAREKGKVTEQELVDHVRAHTAPFKTPSRIWFLDALPKSGVGKILRRELRDRAAREAKG